MSLVGAGISHTGGGLTTISLLLQEFSILLCVLATQRISAISASHMCNARADYISLHGFHGSEAFIINSSLKTFQGCSVVPPL